MSQQPEYISSKDGEKLLGVSRQMFFYYVATGRIGRLQGDTPRKTLYSYPDIMKLVKELGRTEATKDVMIDWIEVSDLPNTLALDILVYDEPVIGDYSLYLSWVRKNPSLTLAAFDADDRSKVLAYINLLPLPEEVILAVMRGDRDEKSITADEVQSYDGEGEYSILAESAVARPGYSHVFGEIMNHLADFWCVMWPTRKLRRLYAQAYSDEGLFLIQKMFFAPMYDYPENAFVLDVGRKNPSKFVQHFQECIANNRAKN